MTVYCFLELSVGLAPIPGKIIIELFDKQVPRVVENFRALCTGEHESFKYQGTQFHRIVETFTLQGGDTSATGTGGNHIYDEDDEQAFAGDEFFWRDIDEEMLVCMAEIPPRSQFFITLRSSPHLNGSHCCFGRVIRGQQILQQISELEVDDDDKPIEPVVISRCGELEYKGPAAAANQSQVQEPKIAHTAAADQDGASRRVVDSRGDRSPSVGECSPVKDRHSRDQRQHRHERRHSSSRKRPRSKSPKSSRRGDRRIREENYNRRERWHSAREPSRYQPRGRDQFVDSPDAMRPGEESAVKYKGRGKMVYQSQNASRQAYGRLT